VGVVAGDLRSEPSGVAFTASSDGVTSEPGPRPSGALPAADLIATQDAGAVTGTAGWPSGR
jgi:hypothetical protein